MTYFNIANLIQTVNYFFTQKVDLEKLSKSTYLVIRHNLIVFSAGILLV